jgi:transcription elongation GreA/GreB family factor
MSGLIANYASDLRIEKDPVLRKKDIFQHILNMASKMLETAIAGREEAQNDANSLTEPKETRYDTSREGAQALAAGFARQVAELEAGMLLLERAIHDPKMMASPHEAVGLASVVELEDNATGRIASFVIAPALGGEKITLQQQTFTIITPNSPVCRKLIGKEVGDTVELPAAGRKIEYTIIAVD